MSHAGLILRHALICVCLFGLAASPAIAQDPAMDDDGIAAAQTHADLQHIFTEILESSNVPGAQIALIEDGEVSLTYTYGVSNVADQTPVTDDTVFRAGSISKSFISLAVMMAQEENLLSLNSPIAEIVPDVEFANAWEAENPVRIAHVLEHTAGFYDITLAEFILSEPNATIASGLARNPTTRVSRWSPGAYYSYANSGPNIAARALEVVRGTNYDDLLKNTILDPLGMDASDLRLTPEVEARLSGSYRDDGVTPVPYGHITMRASGALNTTATELSQFVRMMINRGELNGTRYVSAASVERIERSETIDVIEFYGHEAAYGLGNAPVFADRIAFRGHGGAIDGFVASYGYSVELDAGYVIMINTSNGGIHRGLVDASSDYLTRDYEPNLAEPYPVDEAELAAYAGFYFSRTPRSGFAHVASAFELPETATYSLEEGLGFRDKSYLPSGEFTMREHQRAESSLTRTLNTTYKRELRFADGSYVQASLPQVVLRLVLSFGVGMGALMALVYGFVFAPIGFVRARLNSSTLQNGGPRYMRTTALLSGLSVAGMVGLLGYTMSKFYLELFDLATVSPLSLSLFALSVLAPAFAGMGLWIAITGEGDAPLWKRGYFILSNGLILAGFVWLFQYGWLGLKTWAY